MQKNPPLQKMSLTQEGVKESVAEGGGSAPAQIWTKIDTFLDASVQCITSTCPLFLCLFFKNT